MGSVFSSQIQNEVKEGQMAVSNLRRDMVSQQVQLVRRMAERQMALQVASVRELMFWFIPFTVSSFVFLYKGYRKTNSWPVMFPLIPITFGLGYQLHYAYGSKTNKIKALAENIMANEAHMMAVPEWSTSARSLMQPRDLSLVNMPEMSKPSSIQPVESSSTSHQVAIVSQGVGDIHKSSSLPPSPTAQTNVSQSSLTNINVAEDSTESSQNPTAS